MGIVAFDPSCFADAIEDFAKTDAECIYYTDLPELTLMTKVQFFLMIHQTFSTGNSQLVHVVNQNRCLIATEDIEEWLGNLTSAIMGCIGSSALLKDIVDESEIFNAINNGMDDESIVKKLLTDALENDIIVLTGDKKEMAAGVLRY